MSASGVDLETWGQVLEGGKIRRPKPPNFPNFIVLKSGAGAEGHSEGAPLLCRLWQ